MVPPKPPYVEQFFAPTSRKLKGLRYSVITSGPEYEAACRAMRDNPMRFEILSEPLEARVAKLEKIVAALSVVLLIVVLAVGLNGLANLFYLQNSNRLW